jgi:hypothetical protein
MNLKKIVAAVAAAAMALSVMAFSTSAADPVSAVFETCQGDAGGWAKPQVKFQITGNGTYSFEATFANPNELTAYAKFGTLADLPAGYDEAKVVVDEVLVNGVAQPLNDLEARTWDFDGLVMAGDDGGINAWNAWGTDASAITTDVAGDNSCTIVDADGNNIVIASVKVTITVSGVAEATEAATEAVTEAATEAATEATTAAVIEADDEPTEAVTEAPATEAAPAVTEAPAA